MDGEINWDSNLYNDWDQDGCNDLLEDNDDDNDGENDATDVCPKGRSNWMNDRTSLTDFDMDGCYDSTEDLDDDNDSVNDVNATGATLDLCPTTPLGALDVDEFGCREPSNEIQMVIQSMTSLMNVKEHRVAYK